MCEVGDIWEFLSTETYCESVTVAQLVKCLNFYFCSWSWGCGIEPSVRLCAGHGTHLGFPLPVPLHPPTLKKWKRKSLLKSIENYWEAKNNIILRRCYLLISIDLIFKIIIKALLNLLRDEKIESENSLIYKSFIPLIFT